jgi:phosphate transport system substrate-binding protein
MNDDFLRRLRPMPRAAFVHQLKARLDRLPRTRRLVAGPAYLRTLLIALLIGGAAFAVTMLSNRRDSIVAHVSAPAVRAQQPSAELTEDAAAAPVAHAADDELAPVVTHPVRRDSGPPIVQAASPPRESASNNASSTNAASPVTDAPAAGAPRGVAIGSGQIFVEGAGGTFPYPIFTAWTQQYRRLFGVPIDYAPLRDGGGAKLVQDKKVTFATVDIPWRAEELKASGLFQFPVLAGGVVPITRLAGVQASQVTLDGPTLARIYLGEITHWSDPPILKLNPNLALPSTRITLVYRADATPTNYVFKDYLSRGSPWFRSRYGVTTEIDVSPGSAARSNDSVADLVERTEGAIGYVDYIYAKAKGIDSIRLRNRDGKSVAATAESLQSAVAHADWAGSPAFAADLVDLPGEKTWPMTSAEFVIMSGQVNKPATRAAAWFFDWAYRTGSRSALEQGYIPMPPEVASQVRAMWAAALGRGTPPEPERQ